MPPPLRTLGIDVGITGLRLVGLGLDSAGRPSLQNFASVETAAVAGVEPYPVLLEAMTKLAAQSGSKGREVRLCLGGSSVFSRILKVPTADRERMQAMIGFEAKETVPASDQAFWDYQLLPGSQEAETEALLLAIKKEAVQEAQAAAAQAGFRVVEVTLAPAALINAAAFSYPEDEGPTLLMEIGARATQVVIVEGAKIFCRVVPIGGMAVTQAIATDLQESLAGAELLKIAKGFVHPGGAYEDPPDATAARIAKLARGVMTRLLAEVERSITFFRGQQGGQRPVRARLAGGGSLLGLCDLFFQEKLKMPTRHLQPFRRLSPGPGLAGGEWATKFPVQASGVGTALASLPEVPCAINMLREEAKSQGWASKDRAAIVLGGCLGLTLALVPSLHLWRQEQRLRQFVEENESQVGAADGARNKLTTESETYQKLVEKAKQVLAWEKERKRWPQLLAELQKRSLPGLWITSLGMAGTSEGSEAKEPSPRPTTAPPMLEIRGMFETKSEEADAQVVEKFRAGLAEGGILKNVALVERETPERVSGKTEQVALRFVLRAEWPADAAAPGVPSPKKEM